MKIKSLLFVLVLGICAVASAQNKTLGVGVLHVESPTSNLGFIMPSAVSLAGLSIPANLGMTLIVVASTLSGLKKLRNK